MAKEMLRVGIILDSREAFDCYFDSTGQVPPKMEEGKNTRVIHFVAEDENGQHAAVLIHQTGFEPTPEERRKGEETNGLSVVVALDPGDLEKNALLLDEWLGKEMGL